MSVSNAVFVAMGAIIGFAVVIVLLVLVIAAVGILGYVFRALSLYTIAKRRGIIHPWLAWIPVGDAWILGGISDQYQLHVKGKVRNREQLLLILNIAMLALSLPIFIAEGLLLSAIETASGGGATVIAVCLYLTYFALAIVTMVFTCIAMYDLYASCDPDNAVTFLVLGIFMDFLQPFFLFACRKKDFGMISLNQANSNCEEETNLL